MPALSTKFRKIGRYTKIQGALERATPGGPIKCHTFPSASALTSGTDTTPVNGTRFSASVFVPLIATYTGIGYLIGSVGGTDSAIVSLHDVDGRLIRTSALAGVTVGTLATYQEIAFTSPVQLTGPAFYLLSVTMNGTTARLRTVPANQGHSHMMFSKSNAGTFGTEGDITGSAIPSAFVADVGPVAYLY